MRKYQDRDRRPSQAFLSSCSLRPGGCNTKGYSSTYLAMGFANLRAGTRGLMLVLVQAEACGASRALGEQGLRGVPRLAARGRAGAHGGERGHAARVQARAPEYANVGLGLPEDFSGPESSLLFLNRRTTKPTLRQNGARGSHCGYTACAHPVCREKRKLSSRGRGPAILTLRF